VGSLVAVLPLVVTQTAEFLHVSTSWVRRHLAELPTIRMGRILRFDSDQLAYRLQAGKPLEPERPIMAKNRFQRGTVKLRGKKQMWYGRFRMETLNAKGEREIWNNPIGLKSLLPTKYTAEKKLREIMDERLKPGAVSTKVKLYSTLVDEWKATEGATLGDSTLKNYSNALRAYVLPTFASTDIRTITRKTIQDFLVVQSRKYGQSVLKTTRLVMRMTLSWAEQNGNLQQPNGWLTGIRLPKKFAGRKVVRTELTPEQIRAFVTRMKEPYSTLTLLLASVGLRGEAAVGLQPSDLGDDNVLRVRRVIYDREEIPLEKEECYPLDAVVHAELLQRLRSLGAGAKWILHGRTGEPVDLGNARKRHLHRIAKAIGVKIGGWHDFRHTLTRRMRRAGVDPIIRRDTLGHSKVEQQEVYDEAQRVEVGNALRLVGKQLEPTVEPNQSIQ
jgi:integrase